VRHLPAGVREDRDRRQQRMPDDGLRARRPDYANDIRPRRRAISCTGAGTGAGAAGYWWPECADAASALSVRRRRRSADRLLKIKPVASAGAAAASPAAAAAASVGECAAACLRARLRV